ncbi:ATP-dependent endonuclease [Bacteroidia bacterium]|nr:ATP-dependent endonuclease [Bacteroidia bacterium]
MFIAEISQHLRQELGFEPTADQENLIAQLAEFLINPKGNDVLMVNGYAGTGKTTAIGALVRTLKHLKRPAVLLAPTGRAAKVMSQYAGATAYTIHKKIYRQSNMRDGVGVFALNINTLSNAVFIVDEASMIANSSLDLSVFGSGRLLDDLVRFVQQGKGCKLVLVGDAAQLPPVGLSISPALDLKHLAGYGKCEQITLRQVVRQAQQSGILHNATKIRTAIECNEAALQPIDLQQFCDVQRLSGADFIEELTSAYQRYGADEVAVITRSNKQANRYNAGIRSMILGKEEELCQGDRLMVVKNNYSWVEKDPELQNIVDFIANGDVVEVRRLRKHSTMYGFRFVDATVTLPDYGNVELDCRLMLDTLSMESAALTSAQSKDFFSQVMLDYMHITVAAQRYAAVKTDPYFGALQIKHACAVTCHKAQGGQWKAVFVDHGYLADDMVNIDFQRWLYTALTRAAEKVYLVNFDKRFFLMNNE